MTTWGELTQGTRIVDRTGVVWTAMSNPSRRDDTTVIVGISDGDHATVVAKMASEQVTLAPDTDATVDKVTEAQGEATVVDILSPDIVGAETMQQQQAREAATEAAPLRLPVIEHPAALRSHLFILHGSYLPNAVTGTELQTEHSTAHAEARIEHPHEHH